jgi:type IV pilus assembly protein PilV
MLMQSSLQPSPNKGQRGFSILEVVVTLLVVSIGLFGVARLQALSKSANYEAMQRTSAALLAHDFLERVRANPTALDSYVPAANLGQSSLGAAPALDCANATAPCTPAQLAARDLWAWEQLLDGAQEIRGGASTGGVALPATCFTGPAGGGAGMYTLAIAWRGVTALTNPTINDCGAASGDYGANNASRRILVFQTFLSPE